MRRTRRSQYDSADVRLLILGECGRVYGSVIRTMLLLLLCAVVLAAQPPPPSEAAADTQPPAMQPPITTSTVPVAVFQYSGRWGRLPRYSWSVCNQTEQNISLYGNTIWAQGQRQGLEIMTHAQVLEYQREYNKRSGWFIARSILLVSAGIGSSLQATGVLGEGDKWDKWQKAIAPGSGAILTLEALLNRHETKLEVPQDYLPDSLQIPPSGCAVGHVIGTE